MCLLIYRSNLKDSWNVCRLDEDLGGLRPCKSRVQTSLDNRVSMCKRFRIQLGHPKRESVKITDQVQIATISCYCCHVRLPSSSVNDPSLQVAEIAKKATVVVVSQFKSNAVE